MLKKIWYPIFTNATKLYRTSKSHVQKLLFVTVTVELCYTIFKDIQFYFTFKNLLRLGIIIYVYGLRSPLNWINDNRISRLLYSNIAGPDIYNWISYCYHFFVGSKWSYQAVDTVTHKKTLYVIIRSYGLRQFLWSIM